MACCQVVVLRKGIVLCSHLMVLQHRVLCSVLPQTNGDLTDVLQCQRTACLSMAACIRSMIDVLQFEADPTSSMHGVSQEGHSPGHQEGIPYLLSSQHSGFVAVYYSCNKLDFASLSCAP